MAAAVNIEKTPEEFEKALADKSFTLDTECYPECIHKKPKATFYYQQDCDGKEEMLMLPANKSIHKFWMRVHGCVDCIDSVVDCLFCGGHYDNTRQYGCVYENIAQTPLDPDAPAWHDDEDTAEDVNESLRSKMQKTITKTSAAAPVAKLPATKHVAKTPATAPVAKLPATTPVAKLPATTPVAEAPAAIPVAKSSATTAAAKAPATTPVAKSPPKTTVVRLK